MSYITKKNDDTFRDTYNKQSNTSIDDVSHAFGWANHEKFYQEMEAWCWYIDRLIPDWFPLNYIQDGLIAIVRGIYDTQAWIAYSEGVNMGRRIVGKVTETIQWAQNQITSAVNDMRNKIDTEIVEPVRQKAAQIEQTLKDAQTKLSNMGVSIDGFQSDINTMKSNISSFDGSIKAFDGKLGSFDSKLKSLDDQAGTLQSQLRDAQAKLNQYKSLIDDLTRRVNNLEGKQTSPFTLEKAFPQFKL